jgi:hypothetical protein
MKKYIPPAMTEARIKLILWTALDEVGYHVEPEVRAKEGSLKRLDFRVGTNKSVIIECKLPDVNGFKQATDYSLLTGEPALMFCGRKDELEFILQQLHCIIGPPEQSLSQQKIRRGPVSSGIKRGAAYSTEALKEILKAVKSGKTSEFIQANSSGPVGRGIGSMNHGSIQRVITAIRRILVKEKRVTTGKGELRVHVLQRLIDTMIASGDLTKEQAMGLTAVNHDTGCEERAWKHE